MVRSSTAFRVGRWLLVAFFFAATVVAGLASFTMLVTGTAIDNIWNSKEHEYRSAAPGAPTRPGRPADHREASR